MENYFNYFTEIEEGFQRRRGGLLLLSTLDWALIETWKDAGIPLAAILRGIEAAFESFEKKPFRKQKVNSLAYCAQAVLTAAEDMKEAAVGASDPAKSAPKSDVGLDVDDIIAFLRKNAAAIETAFLPREADYQLQPLAKQTSATLRILADDLSGKHEHPDLENLERRLTVLEEKLYAGLLAGTPDEQLVNVRAQADRELAPYRRKMPGPQLEQLQKQFVHKRLLERFGFPRLSLFYM